MNHIIWGSSKIIVPTIWGTDWDTCSIADYVIITLDSSPCHNQEASMITISEDLWNIIQSDMEN